MSSAESWALRLQRFDFRIKRIPGHLNVANALSRVIENTQTDEPFDEGSEKHLLYALDIETMNISYHGMILNVNQKSSRTFHLLKTLCLPVNGQIIFAVTKHMQKNCIVLGRSYIGQDTIILPADFVPKLWS